MWKNQEEVWRFFAIKLDSNFDVENLVSIGSSWNDRLIHLN